MRKLWNGVKCWSRGYHDWKLHWTEYHTLNGPMHTLNGSTCLGCGKHRVA